MRRKSHAIVLYLRGGFTEPSPTPAAQAIEKSIRLVASAANSNTNQKSCARRRQVRQSADCAPLRCRDSFGRLATSRRGGSTASSLKLRVGYAPPQAADAGSRIKVSPRRPAKNHIM